MEEVTNNTYFCLLPNEIKVYLLSLLDTLDLINFANAYNTEEYLMCDKEVIK